MRDMTGALSRYQKLLFVLLCGATSFEGFDTKLASLLLPQLGSEFGVGPEVLGRTLSALSLGTVAAFAVIRLADRFGRRPLLLVSLGGYALLTFATFFSRTLVEFAVLQFGARMLMVTQLALAYVILSEELPAKLRGRANGLLGAFASVGAALPAVFLAPLETSTAGWRGLFLVGALPLLFLPLFWRVLREPPAFVARQGAVGASIAAQARILLGPGLRRRFLGVTVLWFAVNFFSACTMFFFTYYVFNERGWTAADLQIVVPAAVPFAFLGYWSGGRLMDWVGRRVAAVSFLALGSVVTLVCYQATSWAVIAGSWVALQMLQGMWPIANTITAELFPTEVRANANALSHNLLGRWGLVIGPTVTGAAAAALGSTGNAVSLLGLANLIAIPLILYLVPETRGIAIEEAGLPETRQA